MCYVLCVMRSFKGPGGNVRETDPRLGPRSVRGNCAQWPPMASRDLPPPFITIHHPPPPTTTTYHHPPPMINTFDKKVKWLIK